ncbi:hypothetical protein FHX15_001693 [Rhizobium sp. BK650]|uniref:hypothetical protein n=1 Tax=Rhizobium sp. BK650 TaxID=2586990 RepID=UPI00161FC331|nr:hypothetical protein [Rhizobium sp. BK650]MBB3656465.1 hypothetical protein [Rhizobium sp. BK650]
MSSDFYSPSLSRNLIRTGAFAYRENIVLGILDRAEDAAAGLEDGHFEATGSFAAFPDFSHGPNVPHAGSPEQPEGQSRPSTLAASLDERSGLGPRPL